MLPVASRMRGEPRRALLRKVCTDGTRRSEDWQTMDNAPQLIQERSAPPATLVIFGASGDLTRRKLLPAVESLARHNRLSEQFALVGVARTPMADEQFAESALGGRSLTDKRQLAGGVRYVSGGYDDPATYKRLSEVLDELDAQRGTRGNRLFYLSTPA